MTSVLDIIFRFFSPCINKKFCDIICVEVNASSGAIQETLQCVENNDAHVENKAEILPKKTVKIQKKFDVTTEDVNFSSSNCQYMSICAQLQYVPMYVRTRYACIE